MRRSTSLILGFLLPLLLWQEGFAADTLTVSSQAEFEQLPLQLEEHLRDGSVHVLILPGIYYYGDSFLELDHLNCPKTILSFSGAGAILVGSKGDGGDAIDCGYVDTLSLRPVDIRHPVRKAGSWPIPVLSRKGMYKIRCQEPDLSPEEAVGMKVILSQWFKGAVYPVEKIAGGWLYFRKEKDWGVSMWAELRFGRCLPRYILCTQPERADLYACHASSFLSVRHSRFASLRLTDLSFLGNGAGDGLICLEEAESDSMVVSGCVFSGIRSDCIVAAETDCLRVRNCTFSGNYLSCIRVYPGCRESLIRHNRFLDNGLMMTNAPIVHCQGQGYRIVDNYFEDFSYSAIGIGIHFTKDDVYGTSGIVEDNEICMSDGFRSGVFRELIDAGAIYVWTRNENTVIRNNYVHDIDGPHGNRGIFADDGAVNVEIAGNRVLRISKGYCIDIRKAFWVQRLRKSKIHKVNIGNRIHDNVVDGRVRIFVRKDDPTSYAVRNVHIQE